MAVSDLAQGALPVFSPSSATRSGGRRAVADGHGRAAAERWIYIQPIPRYIATVTKRLVDIDDTDLAAAREALATSTIKETVARALREAAASAARRREVERLTDGSSGALADPVERDQAWR